MTLAATLRRHLCIIRAIRPPFTYPSKEQILERLREEGFSTLSDSSFKRDRHELREEYGIYMTFDKRKGGYYIDMPLDEDLTDFNDFVELLERRERVGFLTTGSVSSISEVGKYLKLEKNLEFSGNQHLALVWEALRAQRVLTFEYVPYAESGMASTTRFVVPGLLFEYQNRFYLDGWDVQKKAVRTFGLDRMRALALTDQAAPKRSPADYRNLRRHVIGVNYAKEAQPERVILRLTTLQAHYLRSLPLHPSQRELSQTDTHVLFSLDVVINKELEIILLGLGQAVEVLEPISLRKKIKAEVETMIKKYLD